ncbi:hypothetical protein PN36_02655 [Candidatus Thiomargarita nelsonii]|uniref:Uncharacterized protein n=1 Tax=Candidatus Thiomargarita nelsonii TaxID=1003181 RepID=A0A0A6PD48_9GAMM|nr:hypothetical protein PN36_02655 [Candidatus Thiomargarita nelsonii]
MSIDSNPTIDKNKSSLEERLMHLEEAHKITRSQISRLSQAKSEVLRLKIQVEKSAASLAKGYDIQDPQVEITKLGKLIKKKDEEYQTIQKQIVNITKQAQKDSDLFRKQVEEVQDKIKLLEREKVRLLRGSRDNFLKGILVGLVFSIFMVALAMAAKHVLYF